MTDDSLVDEIHKLSMEDILKLIGAGLLGYGGYRIIKRLTESEEE